MHSYHQMSTPSASVKSKLLSSRLGTNAHHKRVAIERAPTDESGFWIVTDIVPGRGMSSITHAYHDVGKVRVFQRYYMPGPFDLQMFGPDSDLATPKSTYSVWTGLAFGLPDEYPVDVSKWDDPEQWSEEKLREITEAKVGKLPQSAKLSIWSPDGEGMVEAIFKDEFVEDALEFAALIDRQITEQKKGVAHVQ